MTVLVIELEGLALSSVLGDDRSSHTRHLLEIGVFGTLTTRQPGVDRALTPAQGSVGEAVRHVRLNPPGWSAFDDELGELLAGLAEGSTILIHSPAGSDDGFFLVAGDRVPPLGAIDGIDFEDLAPAILRLAGIEGGPESALSRLLLGRPESGPPGEEAIIRDRLRGLGYIS